MLERKSYGTFSQSMNSLAGEFYIVSVMLHELFHDRPIDDEAVAELQRRLITDDAFSDEYHKSLKDFVGFGFSGATSIEDVPGILQRGLWAMIDKGVIPKLANVVKALAADSSCDCPNCVARRAGRRSSED